MAGGGCGTLVAMGYGRYQTPPRARPGEIPDRRETEETEMTIATKTCLGMAALLLFLIPSEPAEAQFPGEVVC